MSSCKEEDYYSRGESALYYARIDNWEKLSYENRSLDALASLFSVYKPCAAVARSKDNPHTFFLSFNNSPDKLHIFLVSKILEAVKTPNAKELFKIKLIFDFFYDKNFVGKYVKHFSDGSEKGPTLESVEFLNNFYSNLKQFPKTKFLKALQTGNQSQISRYWEDIDEKFNSFLEKIKEKMIDYSFLDIFLRDMQDIIKFFIHYKTRMSNEFKIKILDNPKDPENPDKILHAELNVKKEVGDQEYVGVSMLCCGFCHHQNGAEKLNHRGTHGVGDQKWRNPTGIKLPDPIAHYDQSFSYRANMQRSLSIDDFEPDFLREIRDAGDARAEGRDLKEEFFRFLFINYSSSTGAGAGSSDDDVKGGAEESKGGGPEAESKKDDAGELNPVNHLLKPMDDTMQMLLAPTLTEDAAEERMKENVELSRVELAIKISIKDFERKEDEAEDTEHSSYPAPTDSTAETQAESVGVTGAGAGSGSSDIV